MNQTRTTSTDWSGLARGLDGTLLRPGEEGYGVARLPYNSRFEVHPRAVVFAQGVEDVRETLAFARRHGLPLAARSGSHSYGGWSTSPGITLDLGRMNAVATGAGTATIGGGALLIDAYDALLAENLSIPAGSCPTVGIAGLTLGGGLGSVCRAYGLTCDRLVSAVVVTADGRIRECSAEREPELFWALRGGGGGNFGVVTGFTFRTHPTTEVTRASLQWSWRDAARVVDAWQRWAPTRPDEEWSCLGLSAEPTGGCTVAVSVYVLGDGPNVADTLVAAVGVEPVGLRSEVISYREMIMSMTGSQGTVSQLHLTGRTPDAVLDRPPFVAASNFFPVHLPPAGIHALVAAVARRAADGGPGYVLLDSLRGAVGRVAPDATAFVHRDALFSAQYHCMFDPGTPAAALDRAARWLRGVRRAMRPWAGDRAYVNYADPYLDDYARAYYGANLPRLVAVKAAYDPDGFFDFPQAVPPRRAGASPR
ncbi:FAD-binding oxidoreductase [Kitasatospora griseola]|uniref:FAD-binding oxidoreductase n=1 Tax=Kitasatospora griseola TaxID=2064 RepID=UPI0013791FBE|nr:FAD-binding protein [Kitasatospora griseola]